MAGTAFAKNTISISTASVAAIAAGTISSTDTAAPTIATVGTSCDFADCQTDTAAAVADAIRSTVCPLAAIAASSALIPPKISIPGIITGTTGSCYFNFRRR